MLRAHSGYLDWIVVNQVGMEIQDLLHPGHRPEVDLEDLGRFWKRSLARQEIPLYIHAPEMDGGGPGAPPATCPMGAAMDLARSIGARSFIVHPRLGAHGGPAREAAASTWKVAAEEAGARGLTLLLENTDEPDPAILASLRDAIGSPSVGLCLDVGHALNHSRLDPAAWVEVLGGGLRYLHLYNAIRGNGAHRALGDGEVDIEAVLGRIRGRSDVSVCLEMDVPQILASATWLSNRGLFKIRSPQDDDPF
jgi:sugar phosphate isomerase/epimerase